MKTKDYQNKIFETLRDIFGEELVKNEWDSVKYDTHTSNHKEIYAPRHDIAIGPFNSYAELDIGMDSTEIMKEHPFTKRIVKEIAWSKEDFDKCWNNFSRCYAAIEIELGDNTKRSNSLKHMLGSIINASVSGSIGIVIVDDNTSKKVHRVYSYLLRLKYLERLRMNTMDNLIIIDNNDFLTILSEVGNRS